MPGLGSAAAMAFLGFYCLIGFSALYLFIARYLVRRAGKRALLIFLPNLAIAFYTSGMYLIAHPFFFLYSFIYGFMMFIYGFMMLFGFWVGISYHVLLFALALYIGKRACSLRDRNAEDVEN